MSHSIDAFQTNVFRVKDAYAFRTAVISLCPTFGFYYSDNPSNRFSLIIAEGCECWPLSNEMAYKEGEIPEGLDPDDPFDFAAFLRPHLASDSVCVLKYASIEIRRGLPSNVSISLDVITPSDVHYFYPDKIAEAALGSDCLKIEWP